MEKLKSAYYYFFYKIYKSIEYTSELGGGKFWTDFKASIVVSVLEIWLITSVFVYYNIFIDRFYEFNMVAFFSATAIIMIINYLLFVHYDKWKENNTKFDQLPKKENMIGGIIVWSIVVFIIVNLIFSFYLMSQVDWSQYRNK